uniref:Pre-mRNA-splicing factor SYF2 n=1 Tax=Strongyloides venezuelensis TaxID=75913 RepID=A0A0K0G163_STRVS
MKRGYLQNHPSNDDKNSWGARKMKGNDDKEKFDKMFMKSSDSNPGPISRSNMNNSFDSSNKEINKLEEINSKKGLTVDERNKINAKILKAELRGDKELVDKLKKKLEGGCETNEYAKQTILLKINEKTGNVLPVMKKNKTVDTSSTCTVNSVFEKNQSIADMVAEEKITTATDQITMFSRSMKAMGKFRTEDDFVIDDQVFEHKKKKRHIEKDARKEFQRSVQERKRELNS